MCCFTSSRSIWLMELSRLLPKSARMQGFDIDLSQAPVKAWLPQNVSLHTFDAFSAEMPDELVDAFDVLHIANFKLLVAKNDPVPLLKNLMKMLSMTRFESNPEIFLLELTILKRTRGYYPVAGNGFRNSAHHNRRFCTCHRQRSGTCQIS